MLATYSALSRNIIQLLKFDIKRKLVLHFGFIVVAVYISLFARDTFLGYRAVRYLASIVLGFVLLPAVSYYTLYVVASTCCGSR